MDERRSNQRFPVTVAVEFAAEAGSSWAKAVDLSLSGIGVVADEPQTVGREVSVTLYLWEMDGKPDTARPMAMTGRIAWTDEAEGPTHRAGLQFTNVSPIDRDELTHYIRRLQTNDDG